MTELPFVMNFELNFNERMINMDILSKIYDVITNIFPKPKLSIYLCRENLNNDMYKFIEKMNENNIQYSLFLENPVQDEIFLKFCKIAKINHFITNVDYDFCSLKILETNLFLPITLTKNLYDFIKKIDNSNIQTITFIHTPAGIDYGYLKNQIALIRQDCNLNKKCFLKPYFENFEEEIFYNEKFGQIRPFLTCAALWMNPIVNSSGQIDMPCENFGSLLSSDFMDLWNGDKINAFRNALIEKKQFEKCKFCKKFYEDNFLIADGGELNYKGECLKFDNVLNYVSSAPAIAFVRENNSDTVKLIPLYSDDDTINIYKNKNLIAVVK